MLSKRGRVSVLFGLLVVAGSLAITPAANAAQRNILLNAEGGTGHLVSLSADLKARATTTNFAPIRGLTIKFRDAGGANNTVCQAVTNSLGEAMCQGTASNDLLLIASFVFTGYDAVFEGNADFFPATAHGRITPTIP